MDTYFESLQLDTFIGDDIGECQDFDIGDSESTETVEITLKHSGTNGGHLTWVKINAEDGSSYQCDVDEKLDGDIQRNYHCVRIADGQGINTSSVNLLQYNKGFGECRYCTLLKKFRHSYQGSSQQRPPGLCQLRPSGGYVSVHTAVGFLANKS